ncbi:MAG: glycosyltransferase family 2 protein [Endomicrobiaceae bacterium]|nr:glycosyltransferase family 2 protein [Endomicrobiaceae bacterium]MDD3052999.1 glycosyltransferase family 2 protein [Endomicrobiaceae bacterium]MDD3922933.1 glycosyltransferase family 2 protein [Endomicrobiaceae bacterium]
MAKISIIIPVYNSEKYLRQCLDSITYQTFKDFECICVNDESTDSSLTILKEYAQEDKRFKIISQKNKGVSAARNTGLNNVFSQYLTFIDSDDWITNDYLEKLYTTIILNNADIVVTHHIIYHHTDNIFEKESNIKKINNLYQKILSEKNKTIKDIFKIADISRSVWGKLYKIDIIKNNRISFFENVYSEEDFSFNILVNLYMKNVILIDDELYVYRKQIPSLTSNNEQLRIESLNSFIMLTKELEKRNFTNKTINKLCINGFLHLIGKISKNVSKNEQQKLLKLIIEHFLYLKNISINISILYKLKLQFSLFIVKTFQIKSFNFFRLLKNII